MGFKNLTAVKLGNMKKAQDWTIYPHKKDDPNAIIQCDKRIAQIDLTTGKGVVSDGKGGHNGFVKLNKVLGAMDCELSADELARLREAVGANDTKTNPDGSVILSAV